mmetsp:Transcript_33105/g.45879  ORF Transcript_33105/g.45879 Transcript_33105/m.45879 type:complete len:279 (+) Transcript_33105:282-1118(+)|eukprot:CAMPEP_0196589026 /NCGR_PEP_ID=MMETSP1081-20130531/62439_1 /TAXON_ID=36882 /ORGANISM="Pyramimonas amylifera, Strain CCMP720" /LENGTH=278 /DNA_ID=CAMNT_0041911709 /DNA_START=279 /DNA_END=1115 /DNA_ORIENTATION=-
MNFYESFLNSLAETSREFSHSLGADAVMVPDEVLFAEDEMTAEIMAQVRARRRGTAELSSLAKDLRSTAQSHQRSGDRMTECLAALKDGRPPPSTPVLDSVREMGTSGVSAVTSLFPNSESTNRNLPISMVTLFSDLAKEVETRYKEDVRPAKELYRRAKLDYFYHRKQILERQGLKEDSKLLEFRAGAEKAEESWKAHAAELRPLAQTFIESTKFLIDTTIEGSAIISAHVSLSQFSNSLATAKLCGLEIVDASFADRVEAALLDLSTKAKDKNLEI